MPRKPRFNLRGYPQHVIQRGHNRAPCFFDVADLHFYLDSLHKACAQFRCALHAYVLMTNHVHLLMTPALESSICRVMQSVGVRYVRHINRLHGRTGTLWEGRYKAGLIEEETYLMAVYRYIELNPVRANMVCNPAQYPWSSYRYHAFGERDPWVSPHPAYLALGAEAKTRASAYRALFDIHLAPQQLKEIRHTLNHELALGTDCFKDDIASITRRRTRLGQPGRPRKREPQLTSVKPQ